MDAQAAYFVSLGYDETWIKNMVERIKEEKHLAAVNKYKEKKMDEKEDKVKEALGCSHGRPKVTRWYQRTIKAKEEERCDAKDCPVIAVRAVTVSYEKRTVICHFCLSHFNTAHRVLTDLP